MALGAAQPCSRGASTCASCSHPAGTAAQLLCDAIDAEQRGVAVPLALRVAPVGSPRGGKQALLAGHVSSTG